MKRIIVGLVLLLSAVRVMAVPMSHIVVFGDSLSDNGNLYEFMNHQLPISPPYYEGRFTNGLVWVEQLAKMYYPNSANEHLSDYAFGGSGVSDDDEDLDDAVFTLGREVDSYLLSHQDKASSDSLYVIWMGSNNYIATPDDPEQAIASVIAGIVRQAERLVNKGAKSMMLMTLPDLGRTPAGMDFDLVDLWSMLANTHNARMKEEIILLQKKYPDVQFILFDVNELFLGAVDFPEQYGFTNVTGTCYEAAMPQNVLPTPEAPSFFKIVANVQPKLSQPANGQTKASEDVCEGYFFFDPIHPSARTHELLAVEVYKSLEKLGFEFH